MGVRYFYVATLAFTLGILIRSFFPISFSLCLLLFGAIFVVGLIMRYWFLQPLWALVIVTCVFLGSGLLRMQYSWSQVGLSPLKESVGKKVTVEGVVVREPEQRDRSLLLYVEVENDVIVVSADRYEMVEYGDVVEVSGTLKEPKTFVTDLGRTFNYPGYLLARGAEYTISFPQITVTESKQGNKVVALLLQGKQLFINALATVLPEPAQGLGVGLLLGVKQGLGEELEEDFRTTGIIHIVVLSGYNILLVVTFVTFLLSFMLPPRLRLVFGLIAIVGFALIVGLSATVVRACVMAALCLVAQTFGRTYEVLRGLLFAGIIMLLINPFLLVFDVGFQLSFLATLGLILGAPLFISFLGGVPIHKTLKEFLIATIVTQIAVLPVLLYQIGQFSVLAVVVNVLVLPVVPLAMLLTFATGLLALLSPLLATIVIYPTYLALTYIIVVAQFFASVPFAAFFVPPFSFWVVPCAYALLGYFWYRLVSKKDEVQIVSLVGWGVED